MAKGGRRIGAGRKSKGLSDKLSDGRTSGNGRVGALTVLEHAQAWSEPEGQPPKPPRPSKVLNDLQPKEVKAMAAKVYKDAWLWLNERNCAEFVPQSRLEFYALAVARRAQAERQLNTEGFTVMDDNGNVKANPLVSVSTDYRRAADSAWAEIFQIVKENSSVGYADSPHDDAMERLLGSG